MASVGGLGVAVPEKLAKDQRVEDYCIQSALCGETTMAINVFGVLIWCALAHCSPIRRASAKLAILISYYPAASFIRHTLDRGMGVQEALTLARVR
jgi:hypothetical protein